MQREQRSGWGSGCRGDRPVPIAVREEREADSTKGRRKGVPVVTVEPR